MTLQQEEMTYSRKTPRAVCYKLLDQYPPGMLPVRDHPQDYYTATLGTARAVFTAEAEVIRVPYVSSKERGDFQALMDRLTRDLDRQEVLFTNLPPEGSMSALTEALPGDDTGRELREAVDGGEIVQEDWGDEPVDCLKVTWRPEDQT